MLNEQVTRRAKAPLRINFAGGGTDMEPYINDYGSYILSASIKLYARAIYSMNYQPQIEIEQILTQMIGRGGVKLINDVHPTSGLGASASSFVAGLKAIYPTLNKDEIAQLAFYLERKVMQIAGGKQDQYCAAYGGLLFISFEGTGVEIKTLDIPDELVRLLVLIYTGKRTNSGDEIIQDQLDRYNVKAFHHQKQITKSMRDSLLSNDIQAFALLLNEAWKCKCEFSSLVSNSEIDGLYEKCLSLGAIAGSIMGAGAGGYMLFIENPEAEGELRKNLIENHIPYQNIEVDTTGVQ